MGKKEKLISVRVDKKLKDRWDKYINEKNKNPAKILREFIESIIV